MPLDLAGNYGALKKAMLKCYQLTEGFICKFREKYARTWKTDWLDILVYGQRWLKSLKYLKSFKTLLYENSLFRFARQTLIVLKKRQARSREELAHLTEQYIEVCGGCNTSNRTSKNNAPTNKSQQQPSQAKTMVQERVPSEWAFSSIEPVRATKRLGYRILLNVKDSDWRFEVSN